ncbi:MAG: diguanylate cyclase [Gammaproteobacteria bacterium]|nr:MAG: diguanylate cyclase [Gammaproteobacteria bacterium]TND07074.1 MAG: diguanylate cyclase [Gammaproteobacteria bacterium]
MPLFRQIIGKRCRKCLRIITKTANQLNLIPKYPCRPTHGTEIACLPRRHQGQLGDILLVSGVTQSKTALDDAGLRNLEVLASPPLNDSGPGKQYLNRLLHITGALQTSLDVNKVIETFSIEIKSILPHHSIHYHYLEQQITVEVGDKARNSCSYQLVVCGQSLGQITLSRSKKFSSQETALLEKLLCCLVYPLRNSLLFRNAQQAALKDPLTGINNRAAMDITLARELELARRHKTPLTLITLDIDRFKQINDTHGHLAGDHVLKAVTDIIAECMRSSDILFRYGGEEFTIILSNTGLRGATLLAERVRKAIESRTITANNRHIPLTVSIGLATANAADTRESLFDKADVAMYQAKSAGRNCVIAYEAAPAA